MSEPLDLIDRLIQQADFLKVWCVPVDGKYPDGIELLREAAQSLRECQAERDGLKAEVDRLNSEIEGSIQLTCNPIRCREGGGPKNLTGSLALSVNRLHADMHHWMDEYHKARDELARLREPRSGEPVAGELAIRQFLGAIGFGNWSKNMSEVYARAISTDSVYQLGTQNFVALAKSLECIVQPAATSADAGWQSAGVSLIATERKRQIEKEGWDLGHDREHDEDQLSRAAACYIEYGCDKAFSRSDHSPPGWPFDDSWWKPKDKRSNLIRAGALIAAELDRLCSITGEHLPAASPSADRQSEAKDLRERLERQFVITNKLRDAIRHAGFDVCQTSGDWTIHDVSKRAEAERERTQQVIVASIEKDATIKLLQSTITHPNIECLRHFHEAEARGDRLEVEIRRLREVAWESAGKIRVIARKDLAVNGWAAMDLLAIAELLEAVQGESVKPKSLEQQSQEFLVSNLEQAVRPAAPFDAMASVDAVYDAIHDPAKSLAEIMDPVFEKHILSRNSHFHSELLNALSSVVLSTAEPFQKNYKLQHDLLLKECTKHHAEFGLVIRDWDRMSETEKVRWTVKVMAEIIDAGVAESLPQMPSAEPALPVSWEPAAKVCDKLAEKLGHICTADAFKAYRIAAAEIRKLPVAGGKRSGEWRMPMNLSVRNDGYRCEIDGPPESWSPAMDGWVRYVGHFIGVPYDHPAADPEPFDADKCCRDLIDAAKKCYSVAATEHAERLVVEYEKLRAASGK